jgi:hypothetical protein
MLAFGVEDFAMRSVRSSVTKAVLARVLWLGPVLALVASCSVEDRELGGREDPGMPGSDGDDPIIDSEQPPGAGGTGGGSEILPSDIVPDTSGDLGAGVGQCSVADAGAADAGSCGAVAPECPGCAIGADCIAAGDASPGNGCLVCDPARSALDWSNNDGAECDDGLFCTTLDVCGGGVCGGTPLECDNGVECDGVSTCDEEADLCTPPENLCGANGFCSAEAGGCVNTCAGCIIADNCIAAGALQPGNPCFTCDPARSATSYVPATGRACGSAATACSGQDTCDGSGNCAANHSASGTFCGDPSSSTCNGRDTCDGSGNCASRVAQNGAMCDDGQFCSVGDSCQAGFCVGGGPRNCGAGQACINNACQCQGCTIGGVCIASGARNPNNTCQICDPARSALGYSAASTGACDDGQFCTVNDSCQAGACVGGGARVCPMGQQCSGNQCVALPDPFECTDTSPPASLPPALQFTGPAPTPQGGTLTPGLYLQSRAEWYGLDTLPASVVGTGIEFRSGGFYHMNRTTFLRSSGAALTGFRQIGTFSTTGTALTINGSNCGIAGSGSTLFSYTAVGTQLLLFTNEGQGITRVDTLVRQ